MTINEGCIKKLKYDDRGLIPAIIQDFFTNEVLMLGYMNEESLRISIAEGRTCFFSRSRQELWRKGETSGNVQHILAITADCDYDTLLIKVKKDGPACHTGTESCFHNGLMICDDLGSFTIDGLYELILTRKAEMPEGSYTTYLFEKGLEKILKKVGEESTEVIIGAMKEDRAETIYECADLLYHLLVLLCEMGITPGEVRAELANRHVIDKKTKQETMV